MGSYKEIEGDLLELFENNNFEIIAHGANCRSTMGAGIAKQIKDKYPGAYYADLYDIRRNELDMMKLGSLSWHEIDNWKYIVNLYTQFYTGPSANLTAIKMSLKQLAYMFSACNTIGLPLIGCGIGGLDWEDVKPIIQEELSNMDVTIVHYNK